MRYIILLSFLIISISLNAQEEKELNLLPLAINYTTQKGLPSNETYCVAQDKRGYIWIGTDRGVVRYDNQEFEVFTTENGLLDNAVFHIQVDDDGKIWFLPWNNRIFYYEYGKGFKAFKYNTIIKDCLNDDFIIEQIEKDAAGNYYLSNIRDSNGFIKITPEGKCEKYRPDIVKNIYELIFTKDEYSNRFIAKGGSLTMVDSTIIIKHFIGKTEISNFKNANYLGISSMHSASFFKEKSASYIITGRYMTKMTNRDTIPILLKKQMFITKTKDGYIIGNRLGLGNSNVYWQTSIDPKAEKQLLIKNVFKTGALKDNANGIWITTHNKGVFYIPNMPNKQNKAVGNINGIIPKKEKILFYNSDKRFFTIKNTNKRLINRSIKNDLSFDDLTYKDKFSQAKKVYNVFNIKTLDSFLTSKPVYNYKLDSDKIIFLSKNRINEIDSKKKLSSLLYSDLPPRIICFEKDFKNNLWVGALDGVYRKEGDSLVRAKFNFGHIKDRIQDIKFFKEKGLLFLATIGNGLYIVKDNELIKHYTKSNELSSNSINQLYIDETKKIWIATNSGFHFLDLNSDTLQVHNAITRFSELTSPNIKQIYVRDSVIYLGTDDGLNTIDWKEFNKNKQHYFPIHLDQFIVNQTLRDTSVLESEPLSYEENNIEIIFKALNYRSLGKTIYRYKLSDKSSWQETFNTRIRLVDQKPGDYNLQIEAKNDFGVWIPAEHTITFCISKPYWQTTWFQVTLYFGTFLIMFSIFIAFYKNKEKQRKLNEELNSNMQKLFSAQLKPHFVFNSLNAIQNFILKNEQIASSEYLGKFAMLIRNIFENSNEVLITLEKELKTLNIYIELEQLRFSNKFDYTWDIDVGIDPNKIYFPCNLLQPIVENAIQHGLLNKSGKGLLNIVIKKQENSLLVVVKDNGVGRSYSQSIKSMLPKKNSKGLELTKRRLEILSEIEKKPASVVIQDLFYSKKPIGTEVQILIPLIFNK